MDKITASVQQNSVLRKNSQRFSDKISLDRSLPDVRIPECKAVKYDLATLPKASVVIIFTVVQCLRAF